ncbi:TraE/TraK family type IV conjugative transfer system protein [uncultured Microbulbifer sp.]|uniref:TraE/TraK family type IV conjugative transfer system protein n=1 Tax=uncultured Microbulbifer sp. TaxID=348147 RepID=UPI0026058846|nr:TraE/TraK family type IV conjugative transfer system protein [uncultured Microbulbifer sp.]
MLKSKYVSAIRNALNRANINLVFAIGMLATNLLLGVLLLNISTAEKTIVVPPGADQKFVVEGDRLDPNYISMMTRWITGLLKNYHTASARTQFDEAVRYMTPEYFSLLNAGFDAEVKRILNKNASSVWYPVGMDIKQNTAYITGELIGYIGSREVNREEKTYGLMWTFKNSKMELEEIGVYFKDMGGKEWIRDERETFLDVEG